jgi:hydrogenase nickel incorporation protein HypB
MIKIEIKEEIFAANDQIASRNLDVLNGLGIFSMNIMASPGAGKTSLIEATVKILAGEFRLAVIDGDLATSLDAERAEKAGALSVQINTGGQCHLDAGMIQAALKALPLHQVDLLIVENVGNLVCPSSFKLGTHKNILVASIPEGDDKPYKYPGMYQGTDILIINKIDLLPYIPFRMEFFQSGVQALNPGVRTFPMSCLKGDGVESWITWLKEEIMQAKKQKGG